MAIFSQIVVKNNTRLVKARTLPSPGKVLVNVGDTVGPSAILAKTDYLRESPWAVDLQAELNTRLTPDLVDEALAKHPGDTVISGEIIASFTDKKTGQVKHVLSPCSGVIQYVSRLDARIVIREDPKSMKPMCVVPVSSVLNTNPKWLRTHVIVKEGQYVKEGQLIAGYPQPGNFEVVYAPISGVVARICSRSGDLSIVRPMKTLKVLAHIPGKIIDIVENQGAVIESFGSYIEGVFGVGGERYGPLWVMTQSPQEVLDEAGISSEVDGKIIVAGAGATYGAMQKARQFGARGVIAGGLNQKDVTMVAGSEPNFQNTAIEGLDFTMIMTEGAGFMPMNQPAWQAFNENHGNLASIDGATKLLGELLRPWIFINHASIQENYLYDIRATGIESRKSLSCRRNHILPGDRVRCIRRPYFGLWGTVQEIIDEKMPLESEGLMESVHVRLDDGRLVRVAKSNIEVIIGA